MKGSLSFDLLSMDRKMFLPFSQQDKIDRLYIKPDILDYYNHEYKGRLVINIGKKPL